MSDEVTPTLDSQQLKRLTDVSPGTKCVLVGIEGLRPSRHSPREGRHRKRRGRHSSPDEDCRFRDSHRPEGRGLMRRLMDLGITKGCVFTVVQGRGHGPVLVEVRGTRIALGHGMASRILVEEVS
ncbi:MAG: ferrous iron transport protein A [Candidatus Thorarchaeota archaeon]